MDVKEIFHGSDGEATRALFDELEKHGAIGLVAINLFRAQKSSTRAKVYRGGIRGQGSYRSMAYSKKQWSMDKLCDILSDKAATLGIRWGWKKDPKAEFHDWVLYVDLPTGQLSFHTAARGTGPDYAGEWDGVRGASNERLISWVGSVMASQLSLRVNLAGCARSVNPD